MTVGAVALGAALGLTPAAQADPATQLVVDIVGDSYMAGDGIADTYMNPADQRHRSLVSPALQALSRVASENPGLQVDANVVASSGAVTANYFLPQQGIDGQGRDVVVNTAQHRQIRPTHRSSSWASAAPTPSWPRCWPSASRPTVPHRATWPRR